MKIIQYTDYHPADTMLNSCFARHKITWRRYCEEFVKSYLEHGRVAHFKEIDGRIALFVDDVTQK